MALVLNEDWTAEVVGQMHKYRITNVELAEKCDYAPAYVSTIMNGNKAFKNDDTAGKTKERIIAALNELIAERMSEVKNESTDAGSEGD